MGIRVARREAEKSEKAWAALAGPNSCNTTSHARGQPGTLDGLHDTPFSYHVGRDMARATDS